MRITPVSYNNKQNNQQTSFKATYHIDEDLITSLRNYLQRPQTNLFLEELDKASNKARISRIKLEGTEPHITTNKDIVDANSRVHRARFPITSTLNDNECGSAIVVIENSLGYKYSGRRIARNFIKAMEEATQKILDNAAYLQNKAKRIEDATKLENIVAKGLPKNSSKVPMPKG